MQQLTPEGQTLVNDISLRYGISYQSALTMLIAVNNGGGGMAQFSVPEYGSGQWMRGGMTMVGDMFNYSLKNTVNNLCSELSNALANTRVFPPAPQGSGNNWWPGEFGAPSSSGSQNNTRYAIFPQARRLVVQRDGQVSIFDTLDHRIGGISQQQGGNTSLSFSSQYGTCSTLQLPLISGPGFKVQGSFSNFAAPPPAPLNQHQPSNDTLALLEKLGQLRTAGILTDEEFNSKKSDLLQRL